MGIELGKAEGERPPEPTRRLGPKMIKAAHEYCACLDPVEAVKRAGYTIRRGLSWARIARKVFDREDVQSYIRMLQKEYRERYAAEMENILHEFMSVGMSDIRDYMILETINISPPNAKAPKYKTVLRLKDFSELTKEQAKAIAEMRETATGIVFKLHNKLEALTKAGQHLGMFPTKVEFAGRLAVERFDVGRMTDEQLARIARDPRIVLSTEN